MLALSLGRTIGELFDTLDAKEMAMWEVYYSCFPIGPERGDYQAAQVASMLATKGDGEPVPIADLLPDWGGVRQRQRERKARTMTPEQVRRAARARAERAGGGA